MSEIRTKKRQEKPGKKFAIFAFAALSGLLILAAIAYSFKGGSQKPANGEYDFTSMPLTRTIPNTVVFHYKAPANTAPLYIQQSWDTATRIKVADSGDTYTSVYYRPGFYEAKLIAGGQIVKEHPLIIPTEGWPGLIWARPVPYYLKPAEFALQDRFEITSHAFTARGFHLEHDLVRTEMYNVGNFDPVPVGDADFCAMIKTDSSTRGNACNRMHVFLVTNGVPISMMLSGKGCVGTLSFFNGKTTVSGKTTDLSGLGIIPGSWSNVEIRAFSGKLQYFVNGHLAYETVLPTSTLKIPGVAFGFDNGGAVRSIRFNIHQKTVFQSH